MPQGFQKYSDMRRGSFLNSTCDMAINKRQRHATLPFLKIDMGHWGPPVKGPTSDIYLNFSNFHCISDGSTSDISQNTSDMSDVFWSFWVTLETLVNKQDLSRGWRTMYTRNRIHSLHDLSIPLRPARCVSPFISPPNIYMHRKCEVPGSKLSLFTARNYESSPSKTAAGEITHSTAYTYEIRMF